MLQAMFHAKVGDDVFKQDPTVNELEAFVADLFGMEAALFFPSGTMANQTAIRLHTRPGDEVICDKWSHIFLYESGGVAANSGVSCHLVDGNRGMITADLVKTAINDPAFYHAPMTRLVSIENTTNKGGGACYELETLREIKSVCDQHGLSYHLDGARLWNALVAKISRPRILESCLIRFRFVCRKVWELRWVRFYWELKSTFIKRFEFGNYLVVICDNRVIWRLLESLRLKIICCD
jgi:threonine aldolase